MRRQRHLHEDAVHLRIPVVALNQGQKFVRCDGNGRRRLETAYAELLTGLYLVTNIDFGSWILANKNDSQTGAAVLLGQGLNAGLELGTDLSADFPAIKDKGAHATVSITEGLSEGRAVAIRRSGE